MNDIAVSVVIPVYNAAEFLDECLESVVRQSLGFDRIEVVAVDDGSTDAGGEVLDRWARNHPNVRVVHQRNSGAPGGPRNRGIDLARGEFLFFADPDDYLGPDGLRRMVEAAQRNDSDVVLGRIRGVGRGAPTEPFAANVEKGDVWSTKGMWSLTPQKLFRRSLVLEHGLRFAEGVRLAEEQPFIVPAYLKARAISVVADYDCYYLVDREGFAHLTKQQPPAESFYSAVRAALASVVEHTEPGERRNELFLRFARVELLAKFGPGFHRRVPERQEPYARIAGELLNEFIPPEALKSFPPLLRLRDRLLREGGRTDELLSLSRHDSLTWAELEPGPDAVRVIDGGRRAEVLVRSPYYADGGLAGVRHSAVLRHPDGYQVQIPAGPATATGRPLTGRVVLDLGTLHHHVHRPGRWEPVLRVSPADGARTHDLELRFALPSTPRARSRRLQVHRARPMVVRWGHRGGGAPALVASDWRALARGVRRRLRRR
ncbi:glycosyltransferase [uncultured Streptomyces sp.]|uniref:glycosyltransferase family 2 protein n=1 Tax=uncultured Streptomyces sp. TaxID=174707 RepID=UPI002607D620|nr:glycosyltransferase [uncultured Streptomyces sp.]